MTSPAPAELHPDPAQHVPTTAQVLSPSGSPRRSRSLRRRIWQARWLYLFILPGFIYFVVFRYIPLLGNVIAWQDYSPFLGVSGSPWIAWDNFARLLTDPEVANAVKNTLVISLLQIVFAFPAPIALSSTARLRRSGSSW